jgi:L-aspartate oxidase
LSAAVRQLAAWRAAAAARRVAAPADRECRRVASLTTVGFLIARAALRREETRGGHFRADFPNRDDIHFQKHFADALRA